MINTSSQQTKHTTSKSKKMIFLFLSLFYFLNCLNPIHATPTHVIDNFENKEYLRNPEWWTIGSPNLVFEENGVAENYVLGKTSLSISGPADLWFLGGIGTFLATNASKFDALEIKIKGIEIWQKFSSQMTVAS